VTHDVGDLRDFRVGGVTVVSVGGRSVGVFRVADDTVYALANRCPHMGAALCEGHVGPLLTGRPGKVTSGDDDLVVACPWHHWEFRVSSGRALFDESYRVRTYRARVERGRVVVEL